MTNNKFKIILIDDEIKPLGYSDLPNEIVNILGDETSEDFLSLWDFTLSHKKESDLSKLKGKERKKYIESEDFFKTILLNKDIAKHVSQEFYDHLLNAFDQRELSSKSISIIQNAFADDSLYELTCIHERPSSAELTSYDLIIMDMMMDDNIGADELATYLGNVVEKCESERPHPLIILISHRTELESLRLMFRRKAKISSAGFTIISKRDVIQPHFDSLGISLIWEQMLEQRELAQKTRQLCLSWDNAFKEAWVNFEEKLWNLDSASLQQIYFNTNKENDPFDEHIHELIGQYYISLVEENIDVQKSLHQISSVMEKSGDSNNIKYCQHYSGKDIVSIQSILSSQYIRNISSAKKINEIDMDNIKSSDVNRILPFGIILSQHSEFPIETEVLINLTQQCDLSKKDIFERELSLAFTKAKLCKKPLAKAEKNYSKEIPLYLYNDEWYLYINTASLLSIPAKEFIINLKENNYNSHIRVRAEAAREIRSIIFNNLSRTADIRKTTSNKLQGKVLITYCLPSEIKKAPKNIDKTPYPKDIDVVSFNDHYTIIGPDNIELSLWVKNEFKRKGLNVITKDISDNLRSCLKHKNEISFGGVKLKTVRTDNLNEILKGYNESVNPGEGVITVFIGTPYL